MAIRGLILIAAIIYNTGNMSTYTMNTKLQNFFPLNLQSLKEIAADNSFPQKSSKYISHIKVNKNPSETPIFDLKLNYTQNIK